MRFAKLAFLGMALSLSALACKKAPEAQKAPMYEPKMNETHSTTGLIKSFGENNKVVVLEHQAFADGFMEGMTMSFELADSKLAEGLKVGDKVEFTLQYSGKGYPITVIKKVK